MVYTGAAGNTATQIGKVLNAPDPAALASANGALAKLLSVGRHTDGQAGRTCAQV